MAPPPVGRAGMRYAAIVLRGHPAASLGSGYGDTARFLLVTSGLFTFLTVNRRCPCFHGYSDDGKSFLLTNLARI